MCWSCSAGGLCDGLKRVRVKKYGCCNCTFVEDREEELLTSAPFFIHCFLSYFALMNCSKALESGLA